MTRATWTAASLVAACLALSACGAGTPESSSGSGGTPATTIPASPTGELSPSGDPAPSGAPSDPPVSSPRPMHPPRRTTPPRSLVPARPPGGPTTLTGTVSAGVEGNCLLLNGYLLVGGPRDVLRPGTRVTVVGEVSADMMTTCQQGTPLVVESARRS